MPQKSASSRPRITSAPRDRARRRGQIVRASGSSMRPPWSTTGACSASASCTSSFMPFGVRASGRRRSPGSAPSASSLRRFLHGAARRPAAARSARSCGMQSLSPPWPGSAPAAGRASSDDQHRPIRRRHRDLVGAHRRFGEVLQRHRRVVPLDEVAHQRRRCPARVDPLGTPGGRVRRVEVVAADHDRPARGRTRRCRSPSPRAAGRPCRGTSAISGLPATLK